MKWTGGINCQNLITGMRAGTFFWTSNSSLAKYLPPSMSEHSADLSLPAYIRTDGKTIHLMSIAKAPKMYRHVLNTLHGIMFGYTDTFMWSVCRGMIRPKRKTCFCTIQ